MRDESSAGLLDELSTKRARLRFAPFAFVGLGVILMVNWSAMSAPWQLVASAFAIGAVVALHQIDLVRKSTVLMYDMDEESSARFERLLAATARISEARRLWHIASRAEVLDPKYHAGASGSIKRKSTSLYVGAAPMVKCNLDVPVVSVGRQTLCFFPDRLLVFDSNAVGAIGYGDLRLERQTTRFIEEEGVPPDSRVVDRTWRYVNKKGGPDRRFKDNPEIPICEYEALHFVSASGLNELLHASLVGAGESLSRFLSTGDG